MSHLAHSIFIDAPLDKVAKYVSNPEEWAHWYIHLSGPDKLTGKGEAGTVGEFRYSLMGMHLPMTIEVTENTIGTDRHVWRGIFRGTISGAQTCTYVSKNGGTEATIEIDYELPGNILGKAVDALLLERLQNNATKGTLENLKVMCEAL